MSYHRAETVRCPVCDVEKNQACVGSEHRWVHLGRDDAYLDTPPPPPTTVTLDIEVIQQWFDWLLTGDEISLRHDFEEVLTHPERCQPIPPINQHKEINANPET